MKAHYQLLCRLPRTWRSPCLPEMIVDLLALDLCKKHQIGQCLAFWKDLMLTLRWHLHQHLHQRLHRRRKYQWMCRTGHVRGWISRTRIPRASTLLGLLPQRGHAHDDHSGRRQQCHRSHRHHRHQRLLISQCRRSHRHQCLPIRQCHMTTAMQLSTRHYHMLKLMATSLQGGSLIQT